MKLQRRTTVTVHHGHLTFRGNLNLSGIVYDDTFRLDTVAYAEIGACGANLRELSIRNHTGPNAINASSLQTALNATTNLEVLTFDDSEFDSTSVTFVPAWVQHLSFRKCNMRLGLYDNLPKFTALQSLDLSNTNLDEPKFQMILQCTTANPTAPSTLVNLDISGTRIAAFPAGLIRNLDKLKVVDCRGSAMNAANVANFIANWTNQHHKPIKVHHDH